MLGPIGPAAHPAGDVGAVDSPMPVTSPPDRRACRAADNPLDAVVPAGESVGAAGPTPVHYREGSTVLDPSMAVESLRRCALFAHVDDDGLRSLAGRMRRRRFRRNEVIFHQGDIGDSLQVVVSGGVKIVLPSQEGDEAIIASLRPGEFFGELALLDGSPRSTTATALEATDTLALPRDEFTRLLADDPRLVHALLHALAEELRRLTGHVEELHFLDLAGRLSTRLARLAQESAPDERGRIELDWPFTQSDLAAMIGGTRQSVNKLLSGLVDEGLISIERETLVIHDLRRLEARGAR
jgi:CRP/FNR family transcriptional regulator, cyclic AMP receptor protein